MPADDVILSLKQIAGYPDVGAMIPPTSTILLQTNGIGSPYASASPAELVGTALANGGDMFVGGKLAASTLFAPVATLTQASISVLDASEASIVALNIGSGTVNGFPILTNQGAVLSFNARRGDVVLTPADIMATGGALLNSPAFTGVPTAPTPDIIDNSDRIATTSFVQQSTAAYIQYLLQTQPFVFSFNGRSGDVVLEASDFTTAGLAPINSPAFTGNPTAPTPPPTDNSNSLATTDFVQNAMETIDLSAYAKLASPNFSGQPTTPTAPPGSSTGQIASTAFVMAAVSASTAGVSSFNTRTGAVTLTTADVTSAGGAVLASPAFTGAPTAPTAALNTNTVQIATTAFVLAQLAGGAVVSFNSRNGAVVLQSADISSAGGALLASPHLTGTPTAPTATAGDSSTAIATTAFVANAIAGVGGVVNTFNGRSGAVTLQANDISAAGGAVLASPSFSGVPTAPTAAPGTSSSQLATTSFVAAAVSAGGGVVSFNGRQGAITLQGTDITGAGGALLASPTFSGIPSAPTAAASTNNTQIATTAFVQAALVSGSVSSFNTRVGAVTLTAADITGAGGAVLASPVFTGTPLVPTATAGTNTTQAASTAFVQSAIAAAGAGVTSFNSRTGAVTLLNNDITAAGGAVLASPAFTGTPTAPTAAPGTSNTQLATTAFVAAMLGSAGVTVSATPPVSPSQGSMWWDSVGGQLYVWYNDGTSAQWVIAVNQAGAFLSLGGGTLTGNLTINKSNPGPAMILQGGVSGDSMSLIGRMGANARWGIFLGNGVAEGGSNAGSNFQISRYNDAGAAIDAPFQITRSTGNAYFSSYAQAVTGFSVAVAVSGALNNGTGSQLTASAIIQESTGVSFSANRLSGNGAVHNFYEGGTNCGSITVLNATNTSFNTTSDGRLKFDERPFDAGPIIDQIEVHDFSWKETTDKSGRRYPARRDHGVFAQDVERVYPHVVFHDEESDWWGVDYSKFVPLLLNEIKALRRRVSELEKPRGRH